LEEITIRSDKRNDASRGSTRRCGNRIERDSIFILADRQRGFPFRQNQAFFARYLIQPENRMWGSAARARSSTKIAGQLIKQSGSGEVEALLQTMADYCVVRGRVLQSRPCFRILARTRCGVAARGVRYRLRFRDLLAGAKKPFYRGGRCYCRRLSRRIGAGP